MPRLYQIARPRPTRRGVRRSWNVVAKEKRERPRLPRTFTRKSPAWLNSVLDLPQISGQEMLSLRRDVLNLSREDAARVLRVRRNTIWDWETGTRRPPFSAYLALRCLAESAKRSLLPIDPASDLRPPDPALLLPMLEAEARAGVQDRMLRLQARMQVFSSVYNAAWHVRDAWHGSAMRRQENVWLLLNAFLRELRGCQDFEALLYAVAHALTLSPLGVPWKENCERSWRKWRKEGATSERQQPRDRALALGLY